MAIISKADKELAAAAKIKAGGAAALGRRYGVSKQAASGWGRVEPIPKHLRPRIKEFVEEQPQSEGGSPQGQILVMAAMMKRLGRIEGLLERLVEVAEKPPRSASGQNG